jgi:hypothetical protein
MDPWMSLSCRTEYTKIDSTSKTHGDRSKNRRAWLLPTTEDVGAATRREVRICAVDTGASIWVRGASVMESRSATCRWRDAVRNRWAAASAATTSEEDGGGERGLRATVERRSRGRVVACGADERRRGRGGVAAGGWRWGGTGEKGEACGADGDRESGRARRGKGGTRRAEARGRASGRRTPQGRTRGERRKGRLIFDLNFVLFRSRDYVAF